MFWSLCSVLLFCFFCLCVSEGMRKPFLWTGFVKFLLFKLLEKFCMRVVTDKNKLVLLLPDICFFVFMLIRGEQIGKGSFTSHPSQSFIPHLQISFILSRICTLFSPLSNRLFSLRRETVFVWGIVGYFCSINRVTHIPFPNYSEAKLNLIKRTELWQVNIAFFHKVTAHLDSQSVCN